MCSQHALIKRLEQKAAWVWEQTLLLHREAPETRIASSLSAVEIFTVLCCAPVLRLDPANPRRDDRDRLIVSKGHGSICLYPLLADMGFIRFEELKQICREGSILGGIPDPVIPGYETVNGSLGHGPGVACGMALGIRRKGLSSSVVVVTGDAELHEGSVWEAVMFAGHHKLHEVVLIVDNNHGAMLDRTDNILSLRDLGAKLSAFGWDVHSVNGHNISELLPVLRKVKEERCGRPKAVICDTKKGRGVPLLENSPLAHVLTVSRDVIDSILQERKLNRDA